MTKNQLPWILPYLLLVLLWSWIIFWSLAKCVREYFPDVWNQLKLPLGCQRLAPFSTTLQDWEANINLLVFICTGQHKELHDREVELAQVAAVRQQLSP